MGIEILKDRAAKNRKPSTIEGLYILPMTQGDSALVASASAKAKEDGDNGDAFNEAVRVILSRRVVLEDGKPAFTADELTDEDVPVADLTALFGEIAATGTPEKN